MSSFVIRVFYQQAPLPQTSWIARAGSPRQLQMLGGSPIAVIHNLHIGGSSLSRQPQLLSDFLFSLVAILPTRD
jgi:hypothetical protein